jgi:hypothetical protein
VRPARITQAAAVHDATDDLGPTWKRREGRWPRRAVFIDPILLGHLASAFSLSSPEGLGWCVAGGSAAGISLIAGTEKKGGLR